MRKALIWCFIQIRAFRFSDDGSGACAAAGLSHLTRVRVEGRLETLLPLENFHSKIGVAVWLHKAVHLEEADGFDEVAEFRIPPVA